MLVVGAWACAAARPAEGAVTRYASPGGGGSACTEAVPCAIFTAVGASLPGDTVIAFGNAGTYGSAATPLGAQIVVPPEVTLEGFPGGPRPIIYSKALTYAVRVENRAHLEDVEIHFLTTTGWALFAVGSVSRVIAISSASAAGCGTGGAETLVVDSICSGESGIYDSAGGIGEEALTLRNDTIIGTTLEATLFGANILHMKITIVNTILHGAAKDIHAEQSAGGTVTVNLDHSNFATVLAQAGAMVTEPGSGANQTAAPQFLDLAGGDLREASGSPTIDAGIDDPGNGATDLAGNPRALPAHPTCPATPGSTDIGAYEFDPGPPPPCRPLRGGAPGTKIAKARIRHRRAKFAFVGSGGTGPFHFECNLDKKRFRPCRSPKVYKHLKPGRHRFRVRAVDAAGTVDASPAQKAFRIPKPT
jgi:hypothetical protein